MNRLIFVFFLGSIGYCREIMINDYLAGFDTFKSIVKSEDFTDNSELIELFFRHRRALIKSGPCSGKSINMDMLKTFCEITVDQDGKRMPKNQTDNYKIFSDNKLKIYRNESFFERHFGQYPVLFLDFKGLTSSNYSDFVNTFKRTIHRAHEHHKYLLRSNKLGEPEKGTFKRFHELKTLRELNDEELIDSGRYLTEYLQVHFGSTVIVLIDDLDSLMEDVPYKLDGDAKKTIDFVRAFIVHLLQSNPSVFGTFINVILDVNRYIQLNNISTYDCFTDEDPHPFRQYYM